MKLIQILILFLLKITTILVVFADTDYISAIVNNNVILNSDVENKIKIIQHSLYNIDSYNLQDNKLYNTILDQLIIDNLILQMAAQEDIKINQDQPQQIISEIARFQNMTLDQFRIHLNNLGIDYKKYYLEIYNNMIKKIMCMRVTEQYDQCASVTEIENTIQKLNCVNFNKQFKLTHIIIDLPIHASSTQLHTSKNLAQSIIKKRKFNKDINTTIKLFYNNCILPTITVKETGEWILWKNIPTIFDQYLETAKKGDIIGPIHAYDGIHILEIKDIHIKECTFPVIKVKINEIISRNNTKSLHIQQQLLEMRKNIYNTNTTFTMILKKESKNFYSNNYGDSVAWIDLDDFDPSIQNVLLFLKKDQISMPIYTSNGWCLIKLIDINKLNYSEIISERAYFYLLNQKFDIIINNWIQKLRNQSYIKIIH